MVPLGRRVRLDEASNQGTKDAIVHQDAVFDHVPPCFSAEPVDRSHQQLPNLWNLPQPQSCLNGGPIPMPSYAQCGRAGWTFSNSGLII